MFPRRSLVVILAVIAVIVIVTHYYAPQPQTHAPSILINGRVYRLIDDSGAVDDPLDDAIEDADETLFAPGIEPFGTTKWNVLLGLSVLCVLSAAVAAGLTVGLVSIDKFDLLVILETDESDCVDEEERELLRAEKAYAAKLLPIISQHHLLLVTLLLLNSLANEALPLFLDRLVPSYIAVLLSVTLVLIFGEIVPSAIFTGHNQLPIASRLAIVVKVAIFIFYPIAYPISLLLDYILGTDEVEHYRRGELKALVKLQAQSTSTVNSAVGTPRSEHRHHHLQQILGGEHHHNPLSDHTDVVVSGGLTADEISIITGALDMKHLTVSAVCVPMPRVFMLSMDDQLDYDTLARMLAVGHSRIPVYEGHRHNIRGFLLVKRLIVLNPEAHRTVRSLVLRRPFFVPPTFTLFDALNQFQRGISHLAIITDDCEACQDAIRKDVPIPENVHMIGIITIEDVIERMIKEEIADETDIAGVQSILNGVRNARRRVAKLRVLVASMKLGGGGGVGGGSSGGSGGRRGATLTSAARSAARSSSANTSTEEKLTSPLLGSDTETTALLRAVKA